MSGTKYFIHNCIWFIDISNTEILEHIVLNIFEYIFWYICTEIKKENNLNYSQRFLNYIKWLDIHKILSCCIH